VKTVVQPAPELMGVAVAGLVVVIVEGGAVVGQRVVRGRVVAAWLVLNFVELSLLVVVVTLSVAPRHWSAEPYHFVFVVVNSYLSPVAVDSLPVADQPVVHLEPALQSPAHLHLLLSTSSAAHKLVELAVVAAAVVAPVDAPSSTRVVAVAQRPPLAPQPPPVWPDAVAAH